MALNRRSPRSAPEGRGWPSVPVSRVRVCVIVWLAIVLLVTGVVPALGTGPAGAQSTPALISGSRFTPIAPVRLLDTRGGLGAPVGMVGPQGPIDLQVGGVGGVPSAGVTAVVLNVTVADPTVPGFVTVYPAGQPRPLASNLNFVAGQIVPNQVTVQLGSGGRVRLASPLAHTHLVADLVGWYGGAALSRYTPVAPTRVLDTRDGTGGPAASLAADTPRLLTVTGRAGVPSSGVSAVVINMVVTEPSNPGYLTVYPAGQPRPLASSLNYVTGRTVANLVTVPVGAGGAIELYASGGPAPTIGDIAGYYSASGSLYFPVATTRVLDTRNGTGTVPGKVAGDSPRTVDPSVVMGIGFAANAAVVGNVTATEQTSSGFVTVFPAGTPRPLASNINYEPNFTVPNAVISRLGTGSVTLSNPWGAAHLIVDVSGFFAESGPYARSAFVNWDNRAKPVAGATNGMLPAELLAAAAPGCAVYLSVAGELSQMLADAAAAGTGLAATSCYRDYAGQVAAREYWCNQGACQFAAVPGTSNHGWGKAVDFRDRNGGLTWNSPGYVWLAENAWRYNFIHPNALGPTSSAPEPWHWEWVGDGGRMFG